MSTVSVDIVGDLGPLGLVVLFSVWLIWFLFIGWMVVEIVGAGL